MGSKRKASFILDKNIKKIKINNDQLIQSLLSESHRPCDDIKNNIIEYYHGKLCTVYQGWMGNPNIYGCGKLRANHGNLCKGRPHGWNKKSKEQKAMLIQERSVHLRMKREKRLNELYISAIRSCI